MRNLVQRNERNTWQRRCAVASLLLAGLVATTSSATSIAPKSLDELVEDAEHIVVATVIDVDMVDKDGASITDLEARTGPMLGNQLRLHLLVEDVVYARQGQVPTRIMVPLWTMWHMNLRGQRESSLGERGIFLLKGKNYEPVYPGGVLPEDWRTTRDRSAPTALGTP